MAKKKDDILKKWLGSVKPDRPVANFTELVMNEIRPAVQYEGVVNQALKSLLRQTAVEVPSSDFTQTVMSKVEVIDHKQEPIISKKAWYIIGTAAAVLIGLLGISEQASKSPQMVTNYFIGLGNELSTVFNGIYSVPSIYLLTIIAISVLLLIDYFVRGKHFHRMT